MKKYTTIEKAAGETPLEALARIRERDQIPADVPLAYAGRLDPMASGKLLVLIGEECKNQASYHALDKEYEFEILLGLSSDTGDMLGIAQKATGAKMPTDGLVRRVIKSLTGVISLPYPVFSSKTVRGKPLFLWALEGCLSEIEIPVATTRVHSLAYLGRTNVRSPKLLNSIRERINAVTPVTEESKALGADFRRVPILARWNELLGDSPTQEFAILKFRTTCSSGTYIRALAPHIASLLNTAGLAYSIHRTKIGRYRTIPLTTNGFWFPHY